MINVYSLLSACLLSGSIITLRSVSRGYADSCLEPVRPVEGKVRPIDSSVCRDSTEGTCMKRFGAGKVLA